MDNVFLVILLLLKNCPSFEKYSFKQRKIRPVAVGWWWLPLCWVMALAGCGHLDLCSSVAE